MGEPAKPSKMDVFTWNSLFLFRIVALVARQEPGSKPQLVMSFVKVMLHVKDAEGSLKEANEEFLEGTENEMWFKQTLNKVEKESAASAESQQIVVVICEWQLTRLGPPRQSDSGRRLHLEQLQGLLRGARSRWSPTAQSGHRGNPYGSQSPGSSALEIVNQKFSTFAFCLYFWSVKIRTISFVSIIQN